MGRPRRSVDKFGRQNSVNHALCHRTANASGTHPTARKTALLKQKARLSETPYGKLGRSERIRTSDPLLPKQVRYQAALRSDRGRGLTGVIPVCKRGSSCLMHLLLRSATPRSAGLVIAALWRAEEPREMCRVITTAARLHIAAHQRASPICPRGSAHEAHTPPPSWQPWPISRVPSTGIGGESCPEQCRTAPEVFPSTAPAGSAAERRCREAH